MDKKLIFLLNNKASQLSKTLPSITCDNVYEVLKKTVWKFSIPESISQCAKDINDITAQDVIDNLVKSKEEITETIENLSQLMAKELI